MHLPRTFGVTAFCVLVALPVAAQDLSSPAHTTVTPEVAAALTPAPPDQRGPLTGAARSAIQPTSQAPLFGPEVPRTHSPFLSLGHDLKRFFTPQTGMIVGAVGGLALVGHQWDGTARAEATDDLRPATFKSGNVGGGFLVQTGLALGTWGIGKAAGSETFTAVGGDLVRAQLLSQTLVQGIKLATQRSRPDGSNNHSFPSGHTASAFATASVLQRHFGWKVGIPAYAFGAYVGAARMSADKHYLSDVLMGAGLGIASGYSVTVGVGKQHFALGVAPTVGGAAVMFTKK